MMVTTLFLWRPNPEDKALFFVIARLWGMGDAVWQTQINSLYGVLFSKDEEAAFSNYRLWESLGFIIAFAYNNYICVTVKLYVLIAFLAIRMLGYIVMEVKIRLETKSSSSSSSTHNE
ncbi:unc-93 (predicted) [Pycnogonum litorale]